VKHLNNTNLSSSRSQVVPSFHSSLLPFRLLHRAFLSLPTKKSSLHKMDAGSSSLPSPHRVLDLRSSPPRPQPVPTSPLSSPLPRDDPSFAGIATSPLAAPERPRLCPRCAACHRCRRARCQPRAPFPVRVLHITECVLLTTTRRAPSCTAQLQMANEILLRYEEVERHQAQNNA
jgi:hypothetical protein